MSRFVSPLESFYDVNGKPFDGAKLEFFETGTTTPKDTYSDEALTTPNTNPVIADASGRFSDIWLSGEYDVTLKDKNDVLIFGPKKIIQPLSGTSDTIITSNFTWNDGFQIRFGTDNDAFIFHNGTNFSLENTVGNLEIYENVQNGFGYLYAKDNTMLKRLCVEWGGLTARVKLYDGGGEKFSTLTTGTKTTGTHEVTNDVRAEGNINGGVEILTDSTTSRNSSDNDLGLTVEFTNSSPITYTIEPSVGSKGKVTGVLVSGTGQVTFAPGAGVTLNPPATLKSSDQHKYYAVYYKSATEATIIGELTS